MTKLPLHKRIRNGKKGIPLVLILGVVALCTFSFMAGRLNGSISSSSSSSNGIIVSPAKRDDNIIVSPAKSNDSIISPPVNSDDYQLSSSQSFDFFADVPSKEWKMRQQICSQYLKHANPANPKEHVPHHAAAFHQNNYDPSFSCSFERKIGGNSYGDGPKWVCDPHRLIRLSEQRKKHVPSLREDTSAAGCLVYSVGSMGDFQFETGLQTMLGSTDICEIHIFDFGDYEGKMPKGLNIHYHQWGLKNDKDNKSEDGERKFYSLQETVKKLGHEKRPAIDIFKIDCEGCEWQTFKDWFDPSVPMLQQILVETHGAPEDAILPFFDTIMEGNDYVMFHKEPNIWFGGGEATEFAFLKLEKAFFDAIGGDTKPPFSLKYDV